jgi:hypothetical protein
VRCVGEFGVVEFGSIAHLVAFVDGQAVEDERERRPGRVAGTDLVAGEELDPSLAYGVLADEQVGADVEAQRRWRTPSRRV